MTTYTELLIENHLLKMKLDQLVFENDTISDQNDYRYIMSITDPNKMKKSRRRRRKPQDK